MFVDLYAFKKPFLCVGTNIEAANFFFPLVAILLSVVWISLFSAAQKNGMAK